MTVIISVVFIKTVSKMFANSKINIKRQCELLGINRTSVYYTPAIADMEHEEHIKGRLDLSLSRFIGDKEVVQSTEIKEYWKISGYAAFC